MGVAEGPGEVPIGTCTPLEYNLDYLNGGEMTDLQTLTSERQISNTSATEEAGSTRPLAIYECM